MTSGSDAAPARSNGRGIVRRAASPLLHYLDRRFRDIHVHLDNRTHDLERRLRELDTGRTLLDIRTQLDAIRAEVSAVAASIERAVDRLDERMAAHEERMARFEREVGVDITTATQLTAVAHRAVERIEGLVGTTDPDGSGRASG